MTQEQLKKANEIDRDLSHYRSLLKQLGKYLASDTGIRQIAYTCTGNSFYILPKDINERIGVFTRDVLEKEVARLVIELEMV